MPTTTTNHSEPPTGHLDRLIAKVFTRLKTTELSLLAMFITYQVSQLDLTIAPPVSDWLVPQTIGRKIGSLSTSLSTSVTGRRLFWAILPSWNMMTPPPLWLSLDVSPGPSSRQRPTRAMPSVSSLDLRCPAHQASIPMLAPSVPWDIPCRASGKDALLRPRFTRRQKWMRIN